MTLTIYWELPQKNINQHAPCSQKYALQSNFIEILLRHGCSPVNLLHIFRTPFSNTSGRLLLQLVLILSYFSTVSLKTCRYSGEVNETKMSSLHRHHCIYRIGSSYAIFARILFLK